MKQIANLFKRIVVALLLVERRKRRKKNRAACRRYRKRFPERVIESAKKHYENHKEQEKARHRDYAKRFPEKIKAHRVKNRVKVAIASLRWYYKRKEHCKKMALDRYYRNRDRLNRQANVAMKKRYNSDPVFKMIRNFRSKLWKYVKRPRKLHMWNLIGCSGEALRAHIESLFQPGMSWENHGRGAGKWHVDHKRPIASFDLSNKKHQKQCWHWRNLQPLWATDNIRKGCTYGKMV